VPCLWKAGLSGRCLLSTSAPPLRARRLSAGLTQERLAELAEITPIYVSELERGRYSPSLAVVERLARALGLRVSELRAAAEEDEGTRS
jgi:transcriptional regulator with XRE-family HTH domain